MRQAHQKISSEIEQQLLDGEWQDTLGYDAVRRTCIPLMRLEVRGHYSDAKSVLDQHRLDIRDLSAENDRLFVSIPRTQYETIILPLKQRGESRALPAGKNSSDAVFREKIRSVLYDNGYRAWTVLPDAAMPSRMVASRTVPMKDLNCDAKHFSTRETEEAARAVLQEQNVQLQQVIPFGRYVSFLLEADEFHKLMPKLGATTACFLDRGISHVDRFRERQLKQEADMRRIDASYPR